MEKTELLNDLRRAGYRLTRVRIAIIDLLSSSQNFLSADDIRQKLHVTGIPANRTTIYRELAFLGKKKLSHDVHFGDGTTRYKICPDTHHHHVICVRCRRADDIPVENNLEHLEEEIAALKGFRILSHHLEFFGLCPACQTGEPLSEEIWQGSRHA